MNTTSTILPQVEMNTQRNTDFSKLLAHLIQFLYWFQKLKAIMSALEGEKEEII